MHNNTFSFSSRWQLCARKGPYALHPVSERSPQFCPQNSVNVCLVEHRPFPNSEGRMLAVSFLNFAFHQTINTVKLWPIHVQKVRQASEHLCPAMLQTRVSEAGCADNNSDSFSWHGEVLKFCPCERLDSQVKHACAAILTTEVSPCFLVTGVNQFRLPLVFAFK